MGEATFYQLDGEGPETVLPRLLDLARGQGWAIELRGRDRARMEALDAALWGPGTEFRPRPRSGPHDASQPVLLTWGPGSPPRACLCAIDGAALELEEARAAARAMVVFDGAEEEALEAARAQWRALTQGGLPARFFVREGQRWALRAERPAR